MPKTQSESECNALLEEGVAFFIKEDFAASAQYFWKAFRLLPSDSMVIFNLGRVMDELNDVTTAEHFYAAAVVQGSVDASYELGLICQGSGRKEEAIRHFKTYLKATKVEDEYAKWAREALEQLSPAPKLKLVKR